MADIALITGTQSIPDSVIARWHARLPVSDDERLRLIAHPGRRREFIVARSLLQVLSHCVTGEYGAVSYTDTGKPQWLTHSHQPLACTISHSHGAVLVGLNNNGAIGVDIETPRDRQSQRLVSRYFDEAAAKTYAAKSASEKTEFFYRYWCDREALVKFDGTRPLLQLLGMPFEIEPGVQHQHLHTADFTLSAIYRGSKAHWLRASVQDNELQLSTWTP